MLKGILAISGQSGLFKMVTEAKNNIVVESLETGKRLPVYSSTRVSALEDIAIYTESGDLPLRDVFKKINETENGGEALSHKAQPREMKEYFEKILPDYDKERVYVSDIKKVLMWYNQLHEKQMLDFSETEEDAPDAEQASEEVSE